MHPPSIPPLQTPAPPEWLGELPEKLFHCSNQRRQDKLDRAALTLKVRQGKPVQEAGHLDVDNTHRWQERLLSRMLPTWAGLVRGLLLPPRTKWLELSADQSVPKEITDGVNQLLWTKLMEGGRNFPDELEHIILESGAGFGMVVRVGFDSQWDPAQNCLTEKPCLDLYDFDDFVLDSGCRDWRDSWIVLRHRYNRKQLLDLSKPIQDEKGRLLRGPIFDPDAVAQVLNQHRNDQLSASPLGEVKNALRSSDSREEDWFTAYEFIGDPPHDELDLPQNQIITSIGGICLRATDNPYPFRNWVLFGSRRGAAGDVYPESIGEELAQIELKINYAKTASSFARFTKASGVMTFDPTRGEELRKFGRHLNLRPGALIPNVGLNLLPYNPDLRDVEIERSQLLQVAEELIGVSKSSLAGLPVPGVTATASQGAQQGAATRNNNDAVHYTGPTVDLLNIMFFVMLQEVDSDQMVQLEDGRSLRLTPELLRRFRAHIKLSSIGSSSIAPYQQQMVLGAYQALIQNPWFDQREGAQMVVEAFQLPEVRAAKLIKPLPPPAPAPGAFPGLPLAGMGPSPLLPPGAQPALPAPPNVSSMKGHP